MGIGEHIRFATLQGDDSNDGTTWWTAKRTVAAAVKSIPYHFVNPSSAGYRGTVHVGGGVFEESDTPIPLNSGLSIYGQGTSEQGTVIKLADGVNTHLFAPEDQFSDYAHWCVFRDLLLDGNKDNNVGPYDIVRILRPGFNTSFHNVFFRNAPRYGLKIIDSAVNFYGYNLTGLRCTEAFIHINFKSSVNLANVAFWGTQIDNSNTPIQIVSEANGNSHVSFFHIETEGRDESHDRVIQYTPLAGDNGTWITVQNMSAWKRGATGTAVIYEEDGIGGGGKFNISNIQASNYTNSFHSDKRNKTIAGNLITRTPGTY